MSATPNRQALIHAGNNALWHIRCARTKVVCHSDAAILREAHAYTRRIAAVFVNALGSPGDEGWILDDVHRLGREFEPVHGRVDYPMMRHGTYIADGPYSPMTILEGSTPDQLVQKMTDDWRHAWFDPARPNLTQGHSAVISPMSYGWLLAGILENAHARSSYASSGAKVTFVGAVTDANDRHGHGDHRIMFTDEAIKADQILYMDDLHGGTTKTVRQEFQRRLNVAAAESA